MNFNEENIARFDQFLEKDLSPQERQEFEQELVEDQNLKAEYDAYVAFINELSNAEITLFTEKLKKWDQEAVTPQKKQGQLYSLKFMVSAAAVIIGVVIATSYFFNSKSDASLIAANFEAYPNVITIRGAAEDIDAGLLLYDQKKYAEALLIFEAYPAEISAQFYAGEAYMAIKNYDKAVTNYEALLQKETVFNEIATFHLALAYLGLTKRDKAMKTLESIDKESDYYTQAQVLLSELK